MLGLVDAFWRHEPPAAVHTGQQPSDEVEILAASNATPVLVHTCSDFAIACTKPVSNSNYRLAAGSRGAATAARGATITTGTPACRKLPAGLRGLVVGVGTSVTAHRRPTTPLLRPPRLDRWFAGKARFACRIVSRLGMSPPCRSSPARWSVRLRRPVEMPLGRDCSIRRCNRRRHLANVEAGCSPGARLEPGPRPATATPPR